MQRKTGSQLDCAIHCECSASSLFLETKMCVCVCMRTAKKYIRVCNVWVDPLASAFVAHKTPQAGTRTVAGPVGASSGALMAPMPGLCPVSWHSYAAGTLLKFSVLTKPCSCVHHFFPSNSVRVSQFFHFPALVKLPFWWDGRDGFAVNSSYIQFYRLVTRNIDEMELVKLKKNHFMFLIAIGFAHIFPDKQLTDKIMHNKSSNHA